MILTVFMCLCGFTLGLGTQPGKYTVRVSNLENIKGILYIGWYTDPETFPVNDRAIYREKIAVKDQSAVKVQFTGIPPGRYAIAVFLDENDNYHLDRNLFGIPKEKYGFSNNILPLLRPATFEESSFTLNGTKTLHSISLK